MAVRKFIHCGIERRAKGYPLISQMAEFHYQILYSHTCPGCKETIYYWQGERADGHRGQVIRIKPRDVQAWIQRARWAAAGEINRDTASEHTHLLSSDTAASHKRIIKAYSTPR